MPEDHYDLLHRTLGGGLNDRQHGAVYGLAYQFGHSAGEDEVRVYYEDLADMARAVIDASDER